MLAIEGEAAAFRNKQMHSRSFFFAEHPNRDFKTIFNVSFTDYCGLALKKRNRVNSFSSKESLRQGKKMSSAWRCEKKNGLTLQRGDSFRVEPVKFYQSYCNKAERVKTEYSQPKIFKGGKKSTSDLYKLYQLQFVQKKKACLQAAGHKLIISKLDRLNQAKTTKTLIRPITAYLKQKRQMNQGEKRKAKTTFPLGLRFREESFRLSGWENELENDIS